MEATKLRMMMTSQMILRISKPPPQPQFPVNSLLLTQNTTLHPVTYFPPVDPTQINSWFSVLDKRKQAHAFKLHCIPNA